MKKTRSKKSRDTVPLRKYFQSWEVISKGDNGMLKITEKNGVKNLKIDRK
jgi:hypothetical protein